MEGERGRGGRSLHRGVRWHSGDTRNREIVRETSTLCVCVCVCVCV